MIFVSHHNGDEATYKNFCTMLRQAGIEQWDQESMAVGVGLADQLRDAIRSCHACVFLATPQSVASGWCMAELGAFWGVGKRVVTFLAERGVDEEQMPPQFRHDLWTDSFDRVLETLQGLVSPTLDGVLTPDLVLLLRYLERDAQWVLPDFYGRALAVARGVDAEVGAAELKGWKRAARYGLLYLAHNGLTVQHADTSVTYGISDHGRDVLNSPQVRARFNETFDVELI